MDAYRALSTEGLHWNRRWDWKWTMGWAFDIPEIPHVPEVFGMAVPEDLTVLDLLTGSQEQWDLYGKGMGLSLLGDLPSQGVEFATQFVPANSPLHAFGVPVFQGDVLIGYRQQMEVPLDSDYKGIVLHPRDSNGDDAATLIFTTKGLMSVEDYSKLDDGKDCLIPITEDIQKRALSWIHDWSSHFDTPFLYEGEYADLYEKCVWTRHGLRGGWEFL